MNRIIKLIVLAIFFKLPALAQSNLVFGDYYLYNYIGLNATINLQPSGVYFAKTASYEKNEIDTGTYKLVSDSIIFTSNYKVPDLGQINFELHTPNFYKEFEGYGEFSKVTFKFYNRIEHKKIIGLTIKLKDSVLFKIDTFEDETMIFKTNYDSININDLTIESQYPMANSKFKSSIYIKFLTEFNVSFPKPQIIKNRIVRKLYLSRDRLYFGHDFTYNYFQLAAHSDTEQVSRGTCFGEIFESNSTLIPVRKNELWGFINLEGKEIIKPQFDCAFPFKNKFSKVRKNGVYFLINESGEKINGTENINFKSFYFKTNRLMVGIKNNRQALYDGTFKQLTPFIFDNIDRMEFENDRIKIKTSNGLIGFISANGKLKIDTIYRGIVSEFKNGLAKIQDTIKNKIYWIDTLGKMVFECPQNIVFSEINHLKDTLFSFKGTNNKLGVLSTSNKEILSPSFYEIKSFENAIVVGIEEISYESKKRLFSTAGKRLLPFDFIRIWSNKYFVFIENTNRHWAIFNKNFEAITPFQFEIIDEEIEGLLRVKDAKKGYTYLNKNLKPIIDYYEEIYKFSDGMAAIYKEGKYGFIDTTGKVIIPIRFKSESVCGFRNGLCCMRNSEGNNYYINKNGDVLNESKYCSLNEITTFSYDNRSIVYSGFNEVYSSGKYPCLLSKVGVIDTNLKEIIPCNYDGLEYYYVVNLFRVFKGRNCAFFDSTGKQITAFEYDF